MIPDRPPRDDGPSTTTRRPTEYSLRLSRSTHVTFNELTPYVRILTVGSSQLTFVSSLKSRDTITKPNIKNPDGLNLDIVFSLRISGQLPASIVNDVRDSFLK